MQNTTTTLSPEQIHPSLWRASQVLNTPNLGIETGFSLLSDQLPGHGWPLGALIDFALQQPGIGELQLLKPALLQKQKQPIALINPPLTPNIIAWQQWGANPEQLYTIKTHCVTDALWACEKTVKQGCFGAVLLWQEHIHSAALRRLHLAAQHHDVLFAIMRPLQSAMQHSPAPLRLLLKPQTQGLSIRIIKRLGSPLNTPIFIPLYLTTRHEHALLDQRKTSTPAARRPQPELASTGHRHH